MRELGLREATPEYIIGQEYNDSVNFMTPRVIRIDSIAPGIAYELSRGEGFKRETIYGVSVASYNPETGETTREYDMSQMFWSKDAAESYIKEMKQKAGRHSLEDLRALYKVLKEGK